MRYLYTAVLAGLLPQLAAAQTAAVADSARDAAPQLAADAYWVHSQVDSTGECTEVMQWGEQRGLVRVFHASGRLKQYMPYANLAAGQLHGVVTSWYDNGQLAARKTYLRGRREGALLLYYPTGQLKRQTQYEGGNELPGYCFDEAGAPLAYFPYEQPPLYPGGQMQLIKEIKTALRNWRTIGAIQLMNAQLHIRFLVNEQGQVANPQVTLSEERFGIGSFPGTSATYTSAWREVTDKAVAPLVRRVQEAITQLTKSFYPGQCDGATANWQYSLTIPLDYGPMPPPAGNIRQRGANFGF